MNAAGAPSVVGGSIGAGTILIGTGEEVLIQNSGTDQLKAGFTTGTGGLRIRRAFEGNNPINVVINGRTQRGRQQLCHQPRHAGVGPTGSWYQPGDG